MTVVEKVEHTLGVDESKPGNFQFLTALFPAGNPPPIIAYHEHR